MIHLIVHVFKIIKSGSLFKPMYINLRCTHRLNLRGLKNKGLWNRVF